MTEFIPGAGPPPHKIPSLTPPSFQQRGIPASAPALGRHPRRASKPRCPRGQIQSLPRERPPLVEFLNEQLPRVEVLALAWSFSFADESEHGAANVFEFPLHGVVTQGLHRLDPGAGAELRLPPELTSSRQSGRL
jgi:hypothetical protein